MLKQSQDILHMLLRGINGILTNDEARPEYRERGKPFTNRALEALALCNAFNFVQLSAESVRCTGREGNPPGIKKSVAWSKRALWICSKGLRRHIGKSRRADRSWFGTRSKAESQVALEALQLVSRFLSCLQLHTLHGQFHRAEPDGACWWSNRRARWQTEAYSILECRHHWTHCNAGKGAFGWRLGFACWSPAEGCKKVSESTASWLTPNWPEHAPICWVFAESTHFVHFDFKAESHFSPVATENRKMSDEVLLDLWHVKASHLPRPCSKSGGVQYLRHFS